MIRLDNALFSFGPKAILHDVNLLIAEGARVGLLGRNGAGKTTLFRLVLGDLKLEAGEIQVPRTGRAAYLPQHPDLPHGESILQHVLESHPVLRDLEAEILRVEKLMAEEEDPRRLDRIVERHRRLSREFESQGGYELEARVTSTLTGLGFSRDQLLRPLGILSPGEKNRVALAKVLLTEADIVLLDEPTNHLDFEMLEWLERYLGGRDPKGLARSTSVVVASHDRYFLNRVADQIVELRDGALALYRGNYDDFVRQRSEELERQEREYRKQQQELARDLEFIRRNFAAQKARQAKSREKRVERLELVDAPQRDDAGPIIRFDFVTRPGNDVLEVRGLSCGYGSHRLLEGVDLDIAPGDRVAILGPNGCGKTTFLRCLAGELEPMDGRIRFGVRTATGYFRQELPHDEREDSLFSAVHDLVPQWTNQAVRDLLAAFLFRGDEVQACVRQLSGGERARLELLRLILSGANLFLLDEPTNHLDVYSRAALEESLLDFPGAILFVSHDRYFVDRVATRVLAVSGGHLRQLFGGYEEYRETFLQEREAEASRREEERRSRRAASGPNSRALAAARASEESRLFRRIAEVEEGIRAKQEECGLQEHYLNPDSMRRLKRELAELEGELAGLYREWEALEG